MSPGTIIVAIVFAGIVFMAGRSTWKNMRENRCPGCSGCSDSKQNCSAKTRQDLDSLL